MGKGHQEHRLIPHEEILELWNEPKMSSHSIEDLADLSILVANPSDPGNLRRTERLESERHEFELAIRVKADDYDNASLLLLLKEQDERIILARFDSKDYHKAVIPNEAYYITGPHLHILVEQLQSEKGDDWFAFSFPALSLKFELVFAADLFNIEFHQAIGDEDDGKRDGGSADRGAVPEHDLGQDVRLQQDGRAHQPPRPVQRGVHLDKHLREERRNLSHG